jgi:hypothetical protein
MWTYFKGDDLMGHTPYGYRIENGIAVIDEQAALQVQNLYQYYLSGFSLTNAANKAGIKVLHAGAKRIIRNKHYLGDKFYPTIIDKETFNAAGDEIKNRATKLGRNNRYKEQEVKEIPVLFHLGNIEKYFDNPVKQAEYLYSLIESEVI